jgi:hypothetical protein
VLLMVGFVVSAGLFTIGRALILGPIGERIIG